eukprot:Gb_12029 [translate_table: standard]
MWSPNDLPPLGCERLLSSSRKVGGAWKLLLHGTRTLVHMKGAAAHTLDVPSRRGQLGNRQLKQLSASVKVLAGRLSVALLVHAFLGYIRNGNEELDIPIQLVIEEASTY